ncbi:MAG: YHS domain-containing protein [Cyanothece sp. SIO1E1]|nr:YHS domain-containing protein [Cyanothece sp. SIO1E1]
MKVGYLAAIATASALALGIGTAPSLFSLTGTPPFAAVAQTTAPKIFTENGIAIRGADPVAYFTQDKPVQGSRQYAYEWNGATWLFASAANRDQFASNPEAYAPQYGGYCAYGLARGNLAPIVPSAWAIVDGKLYLNFSAQVQQLWLQDVPGNIAKADANWPGLLRAAR